MKTVIFLLLTSLKLLNSADLELSYKKDAPLIAAAIPLAIWVQIEFQKLNPVQDLNTPSKNTPLWGEWSRRQYSEGTQIAGSLLLGGLYISSMIQSAIFSRQTGSKSILLTETIILLEALAYSSILNLWIRSMPYRPRPLVYNERAPMERRTRAEASSSFYSGHSSAAFLTATYITCLYKLHYPASTNKKWVALGTYAAASLVALSRLYGGNHYTTDVLVGGAMGSLFGYIFPKIHVQSQKNPSFSFQARGRGVTLLYFF